MTEQLLTPAQVARRCQCSTRTVMRAIDTGELAASQLATRGVWRIDPAAVDEWIAQRSNRRRQPRHIAAVARPAARTGPPVQRLSDLLDDVA